VHGDVETSDPWQAGRRQAALQRARQPFGAVLVSQRLASKSSLTLKIVGEQFAIRHGIQALTCRLRAVVRGVAAILGGKRTLLGSQCAALRARFRCPA
jgi:hypothetical protein